ncbi:39S ribosomal protein L20, mitochondrial [Contarinia nasturtii]|uniref:39S ribosomal protein L20, mitochondrial n=1 Tax=Contarinia nasturtii TaxID=265458 RepID=UPI0012D4A56D|nr:39S ribosomal protein L20, mitochondrial [Contarinia nasturtii]
MVFTSIVNLIRSRGPDELWRKRKIFKLAAHYTGRKRNCYTLAIRNVHRALVYATKARKLKKDDLNELRDARISAGCNQFGIELPAFREGLARSNIMLNRKSLADLAAWEPKSFESLVMIARERAVQDGLRGVHEVNADNRVVYANDEQKAEKEKYKDTVPSNYTTYFREKPYFN